MKKLKTIVIVLMLILMGSLVCGFTNVNAVELTVNGVRESGRDFRKKATNQSTEYAIFKIEETDSNTEKTNEAYYCIRGGKGFGQVNAQGTFEGSILDYSPFVLDTWTEGTDGIDNMNLHADDVNTKYEDLYSTDLKEEITDDSLSVTFTRYDAIMWILDNAYVAVDNDKYTAAEYRETLINQVAENPIYLDGRDIDYWYMPISYETLLESIEIDETGLSEEEIKAKKDQIIDEYIEIAQQLALWYFSNYDETGDSVVQGLKPTSYDSSTDIYKEDDLEQILYLDGENDTKLVDEISDNEAYFISNLFDYFVYGGIKNANTREVRNYVFADDVQPAVTLKNTTYEIGPIKITGEGDSLPEYAELTLKYDGSEVEFGVKGDNTNEIPVGTDFYLTVNSSEVGGNNADFSKFEIGLTYYKTKATFLLADSEPENQQAVVRLIKEKVEDKLTIEVFDLALRKYITKLETSGRIVKEIPNSRDLNNINLAPLVDNTDTTAEYKHRKDPVIVENGDIVTYSFKIYNEGTIDGYVYSIVDYLPEGLSLYTMNMRPVDGETGAYQASGTNPIKYKIEGNKITII